MLDLRPGVIGLTFSLANLGALLAAFTAGRISTRLGVGKDDHLGVGARRPDVADRRVCSARKRCAPRPGSGLADRQLHERALQRDAGQPAPDDHARPNPGPHELRHAVHRLGNDPARRSARRSTRYLGRLEGDADHRRNRLLPAVPAGAVLAGPLDRQDAGARGGRRRRPRPTAGRGDRAHARADEDLMRQLLRIRNARVFLFGWSVSVFGDWAIFIALGVWMKDLTDSNSAAGLVFFALALPSFLSPLAGLLVDRLSRRKVMIATYSVESVDGSVASVRPRPRGRLDHLRGRCVLRRRRHARRCGPVGLHDGDPAARPARRGERLVPDRPGRAAPDRTARRRRDLRVGRRRRGRGARLAQFRRGGLGAAHAQGRRASFRS